MASCGLDHILRIKTKSKSKNIINEIRLQIEMTHISKGFAEMNLPRQKKTWKTQNDPDQNCDRVTSKIKTLKQRVNMLPVAE